MKRTSIECLLHSEQWVPLQCSKIETGLSPFLKWGGRGSEGPSIASPRSHRIGEKQISAQLDQAHSFYHKISSVQPRPYLWFEKVLCTFEVLEMGSISLLPSPDLWSSHLSLNLFISKTSGRVVLRSTLPENAVFGLKEVWTYPTCFLTRHLRKNIWPLS